MHVCTLIVPTAASTYERRNISPSLRFGRFKPDLQNKSDQIENERDLICSIEHAGIFLEEFVGSSFHVAVETVDFLHPRCPLNELFLRA